MTTTKKQLFEEFIKTYDWITANSKFIPHQYLVKDYLDDEGKKIFEEMVVFIRENGTPEIFFKKEYIYYHHEGYKYWTMFNPLETTIIINRAKE